MFGEFPMVRHGFVLMATLVLVSLSAALANAQAPEQCPTNCPDISKMVPIKAYGTTIFFDPVGRAYYHNGKKYAVLNEKNEVVLVPADAPPAETPPTGGQPTPQTPATPTGSAVVQTPGGGVNAQPVSGATQPVTGDAVPQTGTAQQTPQASATQSAPIAQVASARSETSATVGASSLETAKSVSADGKPPIVNLVAIKAPLVDQPVNIANAAELPKLNGRWRASVRDFLGNTTVIEMELEDLAGGAQATLISQTTGQPPSESKRKVSFTDNKLTLTEGADAQVLGQVAEASTVRLRITGASGDMLFTRSPAD